MNIILLRFSLEWMNFMKVIYWMFSINKLLLSLWKINDIQEINEYNFSTAFFFSIKREMHLHYNYFQERQNIQWNTINSQSMVQHFNFLPKEGKKEAFTQYNDAKCSVVMREVVLSLEMDRRENTNKRPQRQIIVRCCLFLLFWRWDSTELFIQRGNTATML